MHTQSVACGELVVLIVVGVALVLTQSFGASVICIEAGALCLAKRGSVFPYWDIASNVVQKKILFIGSNYMVNMDGLQLQVAPDAPNQLLIFLG
jgi:hypothetical protein